MNNWIVVVDDEALSLTNAKGMLGEENMRVSCLRSGRDLLRFVEKNSPDLILLDVLMPEMDGFETFSALREYEEKAGKPHIPVIFLTGENDSAKEKQGLMLGASDFIRKPFNKEILVKRIDNTIKNNKTIEILTEEAMLDKLTGFLNKSRGAEMIAKLCSRKTGSMMIMDLDSFKLVNDLYGHDNGDKVLQMFANVIRRNIRETDTVARVGGDEFLAFFEDLLDERVIATIAERLNAQLTEEMAALLGEDNGIPLGVSAGVVMIPEHGRDYEKLFSLADDALYTVKDNGKHGCYIYREPVDGIEDDKEDPEEKLERVIKIVEERNDAGGALKLGKDSFTAAYRFMMRFYKRYGGTATLLYFSMEPVFEMNKMELADVCKHFSDLLQKTLRLSDLVMQNASNSFFIMLTERTRAEAEGAIRRIMSAWESTEYSKNVKTSHIYKYMDFYEKTKND